MKGHMSLDERRVGRLGGVFAAIPTPMEPGGAVDMGAAARLVGWLIDRGIDGVFALGTTGEGPLLDDEERLAVLRAAVEAAGGRIPVVAQVGGVSTSSTVELARRCVDTGIDALAVMAPYFFRHREEDLVAHFAAVARAVSDFPVLLYNIPQNTGNPVTPAIVRALGDQPNVVGMKDSAGDLYALYLLSGAAQEGFRIMVGADLSLPSIAAMGWAGTISGPACAVPEPYVALWKAAAQGAWDGVARAHGKVAAVCRMLRNGADIPRIKAVLALRGVIGPDVRAPLRPLSPDEMALLKEELDEILEGGHLGNQAVSG